MTAVPPEVKPEGKYTIAKIAKALEVSRQSVYNYHNDGLLPLSCTRPRDGKKPKLFGYGRDIIRFYERYYR